MSLYVLLCFQIFHEQALQQCGVVSSWPEESPPKSTSVCLGPLVSWDWVWQPLLGLLGGSLLCSKLVEKSSHLVSNLDMLAVNITTTLPFTVRKHLFKLAIRESLVGFLRAALGAGWVERSWATAGEPGERTVATAAQRSLGAWVRTFFLGDLPFCLHP